MQVLCMTQLSDFSPPQICAEIFHFTILLEYMYVIARYPGHKSKVIQFISDSTRELLVITKTVKCSGNSSTLSSRFSTRFGQRALLLHQFMMRYIMSRQ